MTSPVLGIDLGTTNSVVCVADGGALRILADSEGHQLIPSVVSFHPAGDVLVGRTARERRLLDAKNTVYSIKRLIGRPFSSPEVRRARGRFPFELCEGPTQGVLVRARGETYTLPEISAFVLREVRRIAEEQVGSFCSRAVITVPANFNELQRSATKAAGRVAGLEVLRILNEPTAAALAYGYGKGSRERIAIFDLGGGTFDITLLELAGDVFEVLATAGDTFLGGDDIDILVADKMADAFLEHHRFDPRRDGQAYERLRAAAEWAKCQLSSEEEVQLRVEELAYGDGGASLDLSFGFGRGALEELARPLVARTFDVCEDVMRVAGIRPTQLDNVILVGGSTRMPMVRRMVAEYFGREPLSNIDPDLVVARGAALQAAALAPSRDSIGPKRLGQVKLKKVLANTVAQSKRRAVIAQEIRVARPNQPAFQPVKVPKPPPTPSMAGLPAYDIDDLSETLVGKRKRAPASPKPPPSAPVPLDAPTAAGASGYDELIRDSVLPEALPEAVRKPKTGRPPPPIGGSTLGFGSKGLPVPDFEDVSVTKPVPKRPVREPLPKVAPPIPIGEPPVDDLPVRPRQPPPAPPELPAPPPQPPAPPPRALPPVPPAERPVSPQIVGHAQPPPQMIPAAAPPLLLDVTPHTLGVETVSGYCDEVIHRNAAIPVESTRVFTTGADNQDTVLVVIYQGESRRLEENQPLGEIQLTGLRPAPRGGVTIEVTFQLDADGTLGVKARDKDTGQEQRVRISLVGGIDPDEVRRMQERQARLMGS